MAAGQHFVVHLRNARKSLAAVGLQVDHSDGETLCIERIRPDGIFGSWNSTAGAGEQVRAGDRIIGVNGMRGDAQALMRSLGQHASLEVTICRGSDSPQAPVRKASVSPRRTEVPAKADVPVETEVVGAKHSPPPAKARAAKPASKAAQLTKVPVGVDPPLREGEEDGGPRWFRAVYGPHVPPRFLVVKPRGAARCPIRQNELLEAADVQGGWARLAPAELSRRCLRPEEVELWVLIDGTAMGFARFLALAEEPEGYAPDGGVLVQSVHSPWDPARVVLENDRAWELLQQRLQARASSS